MKSSIIEEVGRLITFAASLRGLNATLTFAVALTITVYGASRASGAAKTSGTGDHG